MKRHATIADIFSAAAQAASPFLREDTRRRKEENDLWLRRYGDSYTTKIANKVRDTPYNGNYSEYKDELEKFAGGLFTQAKQERTNEYSQKALDAMERQSLEMIGRHALERQDQFEIEQAGVRYQSDKQMYLDSEELPEHKLQKIETSLKLLAARANLGPEAQHREMDAVRKELYTQTVSERLQGVKDPDMLRGELEKIKKQFGDMPGWKTAVVKVYEKDEGEGKEKGKPVYDRAGNPVMEEREWGFEGQKDWDEKVLKGLDFEYFQEQQSLMDRHVANGNLDAAIAVARQNRAKWFKRYDKNNPLYENSNDLYRAQGRNFFNGERLEGYKKQGAAGELAAMVGKDPRILLRLLMKEGSYTIIKTGEDGTPISIPLTTLNEVKNHWIELEKEAFEYENGKGFIAEQKWLNELENKYNLFNKAVHELLKAEEEDLEDDWNKYQKVAAYILPGNNNSPNSYYNKKVMEDKNITLEQQEQFAQNCVDFATDLFWNSELFRDGKTNVAGTRERIRAFALQSANQVLEWKSTPGDEGAYYRKMAAFSREAMGGKAEDIVYSDDRGEERWQSAQMKTVAKNFMAEEGRKIADVLGEEPGKLNAVWMSSGREKSDIIPKGMFRVEDGPKKGVYYLDYDEGDNPVVMKQDPETKEWAELPDGKIERPLTAEERGRRYRRDANEIKQILREGKDPISGEDFDYKKQAPPTFDAQRRAAYGNRRVSDAARLQLWADYFIELQQERGW